MSRSKSAIRRAAVVTVTAIAAGPFSVKAATPAAWLGYAGNAQHTAISPVASQDLQNIRWQTPVDLNPQYSGDELLIHYGSTLFTPADTALVPVKTGATSGFEVEARSGATGTLLWSQTSDYILPAHDWTPPFAPTVTSSDRLYMPAAGGTVQFRNSVDSTSTVSTGRLAFFGDTSYAGNISGYNSSVFINTPITSDSQGDIYFGYTVSGTAPNPALGTGGIARISSTGVSTFINAATAAPSASLLRPAMNCAPALSNDGSTLYICLTNGSGTSTGSGSLVALNASTLAPMTNVALNDPVSGNAAIIHPDGTSAPTVGPDGNVYYGVLENPLGTHNFRGWETQFSSTLAPPSGMKQKDGSFGWDISPSIVPASMVPSYTGTSPYLLMTKYNNYLEAGGDGNNKLAILDPNDVETDPISGNQVMKEVLSISGVTPDGTAPAVKEWCINTAAVDPATKSILANSEDGKLYRWDLTTNTLSQVVTLTPGLGEAYTPTIVAPDGTIYAVNNATLFAVGTNVSEWAKDNSASVWSSASSWTGPGGVPSGVGATANFRSIISAPRTVTVDGPRTVGTITFENTSSYTLTGSAITLDASAGNGAWVNVISGSHFINAPLILTDDTTFNVIPLGQSLKVADLTASGRTVTKYGDGVLEVNRVRSSALLVNAGTVKITPAANPSNGISNNSVSVIPNLTIAAGAQLDLGNSKLITHNAAASIATLIATGRNGGAWNGTGGIITSQTAAATGNLTTLGVARASDIGISTTSVWAGQTVSSTDTLVMYTYGGDATLDGKINVDDYIKIDSGIAAGLTGWTNGDFNYDGKVNIDDYTQFIDANIGIQGAPFSTADSFIAGSGSSGSNGITAIPEPASLSLLTLLACAATHPARRRRPLHTN